MLQEAKELQLKAVEALVKVAEVKDRITFKAPTGSGKTFMMALFMERILEHNKDVIFIVSSLSKAKLAKQNYEKFKSYYDSGLLRLLDPYLIQSYDKGKVEGALFIPDTHNQGLRDRHPIASSGNLLPGCSFHCQHQSKRKSIQKSPP